MEQKVHNIHADLIDRCLRGDATAQNQLYTLYARAMFNVCYRIVNDQNDAEDVLQDAFVSAFTGLDSWRGSATFGAWLKRIVVNKAINFLNKKKIDLVQLDEAHEFVEEENTIVDNLTVKRVKQAISQLPDGYRIVFSLYLLEGYDHGEIAEILGITESTSKSQYNRAKKKIRELLKHTDTGHERRS